MGMDEKMWDQVISVHLRGTYRVSYHSLDLPLAMLYFEVLGRRQDGTLS